MQLFEKPLDDPYGYDAYRLLRAKIVPAGFATIILGAALGSFAILLPPLRSQDAHAIAKGLDHFVDSATGGALKISFADANAVISLVIMVFFIIGIFLLGYARSNRRNYMTAYPRIKNFYAPSQRQAALRLRRRWIAVGIGCLALSAAIGWAIMAAEAAMGIDTTTHRGMAVPIGVFLLGAAPSTWMIAHGIIVGDRVDIFEYNYQALSLTNRYDIAVNQTGERREVMQAENTIWTLFRIINRFVLAIGAFWSLALYIVPSLKTPWAPVPFLAALVAWCGIYKIGEEIARHRYELRDVESHTVDESQALACKEEPCTR